MRIAGAMLEDNPSDLAAWKLCALAVKAAGDEAAARKNLSSVALALAEDRNPISSIATAKELEEMGGDTDLPGQEDRRALRPGLRARRGG